MAKIFITFENKFKEMFFWSTVTVIYFCPPIVSISFIIIIGFLAREEQFLVCFLYYLNLAEYVLRKNSICFDKCRILFIESFECVNYMTVGFLNYFK